MELILTLPKFGYCGVIFLSAHFIHVYLLMYHKYKAGVVSNSEKLFKLNCYFRNQMLWNGIVREYTIHAPTLGYLLGAWSIAWPLTSPGISSQYIEWGWRLILPIIFPNLITVAWLGGVCLWQTEQHVQHHYIERRKHISMLSECVKDVHFRAGSLLGPLLLILTNLTPTIGT